MNFSKKTYGEEFSQRPDAHLDILKTVMNLSEIWIKFKSHIHLVALWKVAGEGNSFYDAHTIKFTKIIKLKTHIHFDTLRKVAEERNSFYDAHVRLRWESRTNQNASTWERERETEW